MTTDNEATQCTNCDNGVVRSDDGFVFPCRACNETGWLRGEAAEIVRSIRAEVEAENVWLPYGCAMDGREVFVRGHSTIKHTPELWSSCVGDQRAAMCRALNCLLVAVEHGVQQDVVTKVHAYVNSLEADLERLNAELERVTGPVMACGRYAVQHSRYQAIGDEVTSVYCPGDADVCEIETTHDVTPEYLAWRESR